MRNNNNCLNVISVKVLFECQIMFCELKQKFFDRKKKPTIISQHFMHFDKLEMKSNEQN